MIINSIINAKTHDILLKFYLNPFLKCVLNYDCMFM